MNDALFSIRMRASKNGVHISGAERIVHASDVESVSAELTDRAKRHSRGVPDLISINVSPLSGVEILRLKALPVTDIRLGSHAEGQEYAVSELMKAGASESAARKSLSAIINGPSPSGGNMRGAMVVDAATGRRLEPDLSRGIRARGVDYAPDALPQLKLAVELHGLQNTRIGEALALATKVAHAPNTIAELCMSDNPGYVTGYVSSLKYGYVRLTPLKNENSHIGGRVFFVDGQTFDMEAYSNYLRDVPVLIDGPFGIANVQR